MGGHSVQRHTVWAASFPWPCPEQRAWLRTSLAPSLMLGRQEGPIPALLGCREDLARPGLGCLTFCPRVGVKNWTEEPGPRVFAFGGGEGLRFGNGAPFLVVLADVAYQPLPTPSSIACVT